jgi:hypothetical protein
MMGIPSVPIVMELEEPEPGVLSSTVAAPCVLQSTAVQCTMLRLMPGPLQQPA